MLIRLRLDPRLLEETIHLELGRRREAGDPGPFDDYHRRADHLYRAEPQHRDREFVTLHRRLFRELGLEERITAALAAQGSAMAGLASLTCLRALRPEDEGADLGPETGGHDAVLRIRAARFESPGAITPFLDHELTRLGDLLRPAFGHDPGSLAQVPVHRRRLVQERYRALWDASIDGRLDRGGRAPLAARVEHRRALARCFPSLPEPEVEAMLESLRREPSPTHAGLLTLAAGRAEREPRQPGAPCPLCAFPTHHWVDAVDDTLVRAIRRDAPDWEAADGLCHRCFEMYEMRSLLQA